MEQALFFGAIEVTSSGLLCADLLCVIRQKLLSSSELTSTDRLALMIYMFVVFAVRPSPSRLLQDDMNAADCHDPVVLLPVSKATEDSGFTELFLKDLTP